MVYSCSVAYPYGNSGRQSVNNTWFKAFVELQNVKKTFTLYDVDMNKNWT